jgi:hypothetical protein
MKRIVLILITVFSLLATASAQYAEDALRYSQIFYSGTARFMSMGGAFTSLGGDISSLSQNPAGLGVFRTSEFTLTPQLFNVKSTAGFNGTYIDNLSNFNLNQIGLVSNLFSNNKETGLITFNIAYSFNRAVNLNQSMIIKGINNSSSIADYWSALGNQGGGTYYKDLQNAEGLGFDSYVMDTVAGSGGRSYETAFSNYGKNPPSKYGQTVRRLISNEGSIGEHDISIGGNYSNKFFFGATLGITKLRYTSHYEHLESVNTTSGSKLQDFTYTNHFEDKGTGYSLKIGTIFKPIDALRIGLAFHSPTWYKIDEYAYDNITSHLSDGSKYDVSNVPLRFNYALTTPYRLLAGVGVQIKKIALLSFDYEFVDYSSARFAHTRDDNYDYSDKNMGIKNSLKSASNIRLGGELRLNKLYLRTGYGYYGKAFKPGDDNSNLDYSSISFGAGIREQNVSIDFAYTNYRYSQKYILYPLDQNFNPAIANINAMRNIFTMTIGYKFGI